MSNNLHSYFGKKIDTNAKSIPKPAQNKFLNKKLKNPESDEEPLPIGSKFKKRKIILDSSDEDSPDVFIKKPPPSTRAQPKNHNLKRQKDINNENIEPNLKNDKLKNDKTEIQNRVLTPIDPAEFFKLSENSAKKRKNEICDDESVLKKVHFEIKTEEIQKSPEFYKEKATETSLTEDVKNIVILPKISENLIQVPAPETKVPQKHIIDQNDLLSSNSQFLNKDKIEKSETPICITNFVEKVNIKEEIPKNVNNTNNNLPPKINLQSQPITKIADKKFTEISKINPNSDEKFVFKVQPDISNEILWVDKFKPKSSSEIVGQIGTKSPAYKLKIWLEQWKNNRKVKKNFLSGKEDGSSFKAALISGPPGIGKSTTATLICRELGFDIVEMNASDQRNKKCIDTILSCSLQNVRIGSRNSSRSVVIMDEVDGMSGNEDRGGIQEIITLIKTTQMPVICICNDRMHQKIRSLSNHCFDLRFYRPRIDNIRAFVSKISTRENISIDSNEIDQLITASNNDIRSILNNLQLYSMNKSESSNFKNISLEKDSNENIFDIGRKIFNKIDPPKFTIHDKNNLFFMDYSLIPLFVQENYLSTFYNNKKNYDIVKAADCISIGDTCDNRIKSTNNWSLLPTYAILSSVLPTEFVAGSFKGMINFPQILGKTSNMNKNKRVVQEFVHHSHLKSQLSRSGFVLDFLPYFKNHFYNPLIVENSADLGVKKVITMMDDYDITREDWDSMVELSQWSSLKLPIIQTKTKSAFTRSINKLDRTLPYSMLNSLKSKADVFDENESGNDEEPTDQNDPMVKMVSAPVKVSKPKAQRKTKAK